MERSRKKSRSESDDGPVRHSRLWRFVGLVSAAAFALLIALTVMQCSIKKPEAPSWNSTLRIPLAADRLDVANLLLRLDNGDELVDESGNIGLFYSDVLDTVDLGADLLLPLQSQVIPQAMGQVNIGTIPGVAVTADMAKFYAGPAGSIPPFDVNDTATLGPVTSYTWIAPAYGLAYIKVTNQFGLDFDSVTLAVTDLVAGPLGSFNFAGGIPTGATDSQTVSIVGRQLFNTFEYQLYAHCIGGTLLTLANSYLNVAFAFSDTVVIDSALMEVPSVVRTQNEDLGFTGNADLVSVQNAAIASGQLTVTIENRTGLAAAVTFSAPSFTQGAVPLARNVAVPAHDTTFLAIDLSNYLWVPEEANPPQHFTVTAVATTVPSAPAHVLVRRDDSLVVSAQLDNVQAGTVTGVLAPQRLALPAFQQTITTPSELASFHLATASLELDIHNGSGAEAWLDLLLTADNGKSTVIQGLVASGSAAAPVVTRLSEPNLAGFLDPFPGSIQLAGTATFGDSVRAFTFSAADFAYADVALRSPLAVRVDSVTIRGDAEGQDITGSDLGEFVDKLEGGALRLKGSNHLPLDASVTLYVATDSAGVFAAPDLQLGPVHVGAGILDAGGRVVDTAAFDAELPLSQADLNLFRAGRLYFAVDFHLDGTAGQTVLLTALDYLDLVAYFTVTMRNGKEAW